MEGLLYRYLVRRTSGAEDREVYAWLEASEKNRSLFFEVAAVWSAHRTLISPATGERCDAMLRRLNARIDADDAMQRPARLAWRRWMSAAAAAAVVVIAVAAAWLAGLRLPETGRFQSYANHTGDVAVLHLEDGTQVWLQDGTELRYAVGKGDGERIVRLDGEAYFDVSHDARHPFVVETRELAIRVLGTAFNVRALAGDPFTEVVLERGAVRLETPGGDNLVRLHPNQRAVYDARMGDMEVAEINAPLYVTRRYNLVTMKGATITEIIAGIEKTSKALPTGATIGGSGTGTTKPNCSACLIVMPSWSWPSRIRTSFRCCPAPRNLPGLPPRKPAPCKWKASSMHWISCISGCISLVHSRR